MTTDSAKNRSKQAKTVNQHEPTKEEHTQPAGATEDNTNGQESEDMGTAKFNGFDWPIVDEREIDGKTYPVLQVNENRYVLKNDKLYQTIPVDGKWQGRKGKLPVPQGEKSASTAKSVKVSEKTFRILNAIKAITGEDVENIIENSVSLIAQANDINEALLKRIVERIEKQ